MITAIDTNVIVVLWDQEQSQVARTALDAALIRGRLVVAAPVYAELLAAPRRDESFVDSFFSDTGIFIDWELPEAVWRLAGQAFNRYATRRRKQDGERPRRILADFLIGAHAFHQCDVLLTFDERLYRSAFPELKLISA